MMTSTPQNTCVIKKRHSYSCWWREGLFVLVTLPKMLRVAGMFYVTRMLCY